MNSCAHFLKWTQWKAFVEFNKISFYEFVLQDVAELQIDNFHYVSQNLSFTWQSETDF